MVMKPRVVSVVAYLVCGGGEDDHENDGNGDDGDFFRGVGVIAYMLVSGGVSPFWAGNRYRTMAKVITLIFLMIIVITDFCHFFTQAKFLENKIYTEKMRKLRHNTQ